MISEISGMKSNNNNALVWDRTTNAHTRTQWWTIFKYWSILVGEFEDVLVRFTIFDLVPIGLRIAAVRYWSVRPPTISKANHASYTQWNWLAEIETVNSYNYSYSAFEKLTRFAFWVWLPGRLICSSSQQETGDKDNLAARESLKN